MTFERLEAETQKKLISGLAQGQLAQILDDMAPDDRTSFFGELPAAVTWQLLEYLSSEQRQVASWLLGYPTDSIGRLMTPEYITVYERWTVAHVLDHIRQHGDDRETFDVIYIVDAADKLTDDLRIRELLLAPPQAKISDLLNHQFVALKATDNQETAIQEFRNFDRVALPVTDSEGVLIGIVTVDDVLELVEEETTEDIHKIGGSESLSTPYLATPLIRLIHKRARWLVVLFLGEMLTASALSYFEGELARAIILALFIPLIVSSGGNSGSQAATFVIRALALGEVALSDWWKVFWREFCSGLLLGLLLGAIGVLRVILWANLFGMYGDHWMLIAWTIGTSLLGVVLWGTLSGSMLPFIMQRLGADPAASSTPFVATLVDVVGIIIYFSVASVVLAGTLL